MSYRENPKDMPSDRVSAKEKLRALAEEGEHIKVAEDAKHQKQREDEAQRKQKLDSIEKAAKRDKNLREGICHTKNYWLRSTIVCALLGVAIIAAISPQNEEIFLSIVFGFFGVSFGGMLLAWLVATFVWRRVLQGEQRRLAGLPFSASGYFELLSQDPNSSQEISVQISFAEQSPDDDLLRGLLARKGATLHNNSGGAANAKSSKIPCSSNLDGDETNYNYHVWMRDFLTEIALPLHEAFPIRAIFFS